MEATGIGIFAYDLEAGTLHWDARTRALFGVPEGAPVTYADSFLPALHPQDRDRVDAAVQAALEPDGPGTFECEYRIAAGGVSRWLSARGQLALVAGRAVRLVGTVSDVTRSKDAEIAVRATEERYRLAARATNDAIWDWDLIDDTVLWNAALTTAYGWQPDAVEPTGAWWLSRVHPDDRPGVEADIRAAIAGASTTGATNTASCGPMAATPTSSTGATWSATRPAGRCG